MVAAVVAADADEDADDADGVDDGSANADARRPPQLRHKRSLLPKPRSGRSDTSCCSRANACVSEEK